MSRVFAGGTLLVQGSLGTGSGKSEMRTPIIILLLSSAPLVGPAMAVDAEALAKAKHCDACHDISRDISRPDEVSGRSAAQNIGPSFRDLGQRFIGLKNSKRMLSGVIEAGTNTKPGMYHWGSIVQMPAGYPKIVPVSKDEAETLADYVLTFSGGTR